MPATSRREFLDAIPAPSVALSAAGCGGPAAFAAMGPNDKFDLVIKGGEVLDPSQNLRAKRDIGIRFGVIEALAADIPADKAQQVLSAAGKLVTPGPHRPARPRLPVRLGHRHSRRRAASPSRRTTTLVSAGDAGANNIRRLPPRHRRPDPRPALCLRAHRQHRSRRRSRCPSSTTSTSRRPMPPPRRWRRMPTSCSASRCA